MCLDAIPVQNNLDVDVKDIVHLCMFMSFMQPVADFLCYSG